MKPGIILSVAAALAGFYALDRFLAALESSELAGEARTHYVRGEQLLSAGRATEAVAELARAHTLARRNRGYQLGLARALMAAGRLPEADSSLDALLDEDSNDGAANLAMARLQVKKGNSREADAYYHRALYGTWRQGTDTSAVRMELAEYLASKGLQKELLSELLLLQDRQEGPEWRAKIGRLFLAAGSPERSATIYRALLKQDPDNVDAYAGLGEAALSEGRFHSAATAFLDALKRRPGDRALIQRLQFTSLLNSLDPTPRRLTSREKFARSVRILDLARADLARCVENRPVPEQVQALLDSADRVRTGAVKGPFTNELSEARLSVAEQLWRARTGICGESLANNDPLRPLMNQLTQ